MTISKALKAGVDASYNHEAAREPIGVTTSSQLYKVEHEEVHVSNDSKVVSRDAQFHQSLLIPISSFLKMENRP